MRKRPRCRLITGHFDARGRVQGTSVLVVVKTHSCRHRRSFERFCDVNGLTSFVPHDICDGKWGYKTTFEVSGPPDALEKLLGMPFVVSYYFPLDVKPPRMPPGGR